MLLSEQDKRILDEAKDEISDSLMWGGKIEGWYETMQRKGFSGSRKDFMTWLKKNKMGECWDLKRLDNPRIGNEYLALFGDLAEKVKKAFEEGATFNEALEYAQSLGFQGKRRAFVTFIEQRKLYKRKSYRDVQSELGARDAKIQKMIDAGMDVREIRRELEKSGFQCTRDSVKRYLANRHKNVTISGFFAVIKDRIKNKFKNVWRRWRAGWMRKQWAKRQKSF